MIAFLFIPIWEKESMVDNKKASLDAFYLKEYTLQNDWVETYTREAYYVAIFAILAVINSIFTIFKYKNRITQMKMVGLNAVLIMFAVGISAYLSIQGEGLFATDQKGTYLAGFYIPVGALLLNVLANRFIRKDEMLVRSVDRIR